ncbi:hypothetical protein PM082_018576 [Marasmius tenuissimus]|nr:hypothetical protein PM082_018576 [Marasmius tenuissimus]
MLEATAKLSNALLCSSWENLALGACSANLRAGGKWLLSYSERQHTGQIAFAHTYHARPHTLATVLIHTFVHYS